MTTKHRISRLAACLSAIVGLAVAAHALAASAPPQDASPQNIVRRIGTVKAISGSTLTLAPESGPQITAVVQPAAHILRLMPGQKDPKNATPIQLQDVQVGDMVRVRGFGPSDAQSINALEVLVISRSVVSAVGDQIRQDWQKRGMGGLVESVDPATGTITVTIPSIAGKKTVAVQTNKATVVRRYAPDFVKFEDAKPSALRDIQQGDQLRARGERSADGAQFSAEEVVTGSFPYIIGTIKSVDASAGTLSVQDILSKKTVQVKTTADSQLHKIPAEVAQRFAARLKGGMGSGASSAGGASSAATGAGQSSPPPGAPAGGNQPNGGATAGPGTGGGGTRTGGPPDFQQLLSRLPASTLADLNLQKGDAVVILATQGTSSTPSTAVTLLSGVEPILQAAPNAGQALMLAPWNLGGAPGGDAGSQ